MWHLQRPSVRDVHPKGTEGLGVQEILDFFAEHG